MFQCNVQFCYRYVKASINIFYTTEFAIDNKAFSYDRYVKGIYLSIFSEKKFTTEFAIDNKAFSYDRQLHLSEHLFEFF